MSSSTKANDWPRRTLPLEQFVSESSVAADAGGLQGRWTEFIRSFGAETYWVVPFSPRLLSRPNFPMPPIAIANKVPSGWHEHYRARNFIRHDPVIKKGLAGGSVFTGKEALAEHRSPEAERIVAESMEFGVSDPSGHVLLSLSFGPETRLWTTLCLPSADISLDSTTKLVLRTALFVFYARHKEFQTKPTFGSDVPTLTPRERDVLHWIALGWTKAEIAEYLYISESCVKRHCENASYKLGVNNMASAVARAMSYGLINI